MENPLSCQREVWRILKPNGTLGLSTTHAGVRLAPLLDAIKNELRKAGKFNALEEDYERVREVNEYIEQTIALRYTLDDYRRWVRSAGFEIVREESSTYVGAVMLLHARKIQTLPASEP